MCRMALPRRMKRAITSGSHRDPETSRVGVVLRVRVDSDVGALGNPALLPSSTPSKLLLTRLLRTR
jgi:hypothetical protein